MSTRPSPGADEEPRLPSLQTPAAWVSRIRPHSHAVRKGTTDDKNDNFRVEFIPGGSISPVRKERDGRSPLLMQGQERQGLVPDAGGGQASKNPQARSKPGYKVT